MNCDYVGQSGTTHAYNARPQLGTRSGTQVVSTAVAPQRQYPTGRAVHAFVSKASMTSSTGSIDKDAKTPSIQST